MAAFEGLSIKASNGTEAPAFHWTQDSLSTLAYLAKGIRNNPNNKSATEEDVIKLVHEAFTKVAPLASKVTVQEVKDRLPQTQRASKTAVAVTNFSSENGIEEITDEFAPDASTPKAPSPVSDFSISGKCDTDNPARSRV